MDYQPLFTKDKSKGSAAGTPLLLLSSPVKLLEVAKIHGTADTWHS
jgi:hypothetical protein